MDKSGDAPKKIWVGAGLLLLALLACWPSTRALWDYWVDPHSGAEHGLLVAALSGWLLCRASPMLAIRPTQFSPAWYLVLLLCSIAWLVCLRAGIQDLHLMLMPVILLLVLLALFGYEGAKAFAFPIGYLGFSLPAWGTLGDGLQDLTTTAVAVLAPFVGLPAHFSGHLVMLPNGVFEIARGCSGVNFLVVGLATMALLGELEDASLPRRALLLGGVALVAIVSNWLRVLAIIAIGYATDMRHVLVTRGHLLFGWVLFTAILLVFVRLVSRPGAAQQPNEAATAPMAAAIAGKIRPTLPLWGAVGAVTVLLLSVGIVHAFNPTRVTGGAPKQIDPPVGRAQWRGPMPVGEGAWQPQFIGRHIQWHVAYEGAGANRVEVVGVGYDAQEQGRELVNEGNSLLGNDALTVLEDRMVAAHDIPYREALITDPQGHRWVIWSVYDIGGRQFVVPLFSQLWYGVSSLTGTPYSALFAFRASCVPTCDAARAVLSSFLRDMSGEVFTSVVRERAHTASSKPV
ncbi:MAG TPA: EpsI family protein [Steroidobacteraceae bacterium]|nr:EpsI family protein [Steroidobacteraceae bacterium]